MPNKIEEFHDNTGNGIIVDTNLLLLLLIGRMDEDYIEKFPRTSMFTKNDYNVLVRILRKYDKIITAPNILTEVDNFTKQIKSKKHKNIPRILLTQFLHDGTFEERYIETKLLCVDDYFHYLGIADIVIKKISDEKIGVVTKDGKLHALLTKNDIPSINFSNYMEKINKYR